MKLIIRIIAIAALTYFISPFTIWWVAMVIAFAICYAFPSTGLNAFVAGFLGVGLTWMGYAWKLDTENASAFSTQVAEIIGLGDPLYLVFATGLVGGLAGGFASLSGTSFRQLFQKRKQRGYYG